jgi:hypothetical protein
MISICKARQIVNSHTSINSSFHNTEDKIIVIMKSLQLVAVFGLLLAVTGSPQSKHKVFCSGFREKLKERLLKNSPCGEGVKPFSCKCKSGEEFTLG